WLASAPGGRRHKNRGFRGPSATVRASARAACGSPRPELQLVGTLIEPVFVGGTTYRIRYHPLDLAVPSICLASAPGCRRPKNRGFRGSGPLVHPSARAACRPPRPELQLV